MTLLTFARAALPSRTPAPTPQRAASALPQRTPRFAGYDVTSIRTHAPYLARQAKPAQAKKITLSDALKRSLTFEDFAAVVQENFGIDAKVGTFAEQKTWVPDLEPAQFTTWSPYGETTDYTEIVRALDTYEKTIGIPRAVKKLRFFEKAWREKGDKTVFEQSNTLAEFQGDAIIVFKKGSEATPSYAQERSEPGSASSKMQAGTGKNLFTNVVHELGHATESARGGLDEAREFESEIGWRRDPDGSNARLYDLGRPGVREARLKNTPPPADAQITAENWNSGNWGEQPVSEYAATDPGEDYAESVQVFLTKPDVLKKRSRRRFDFISKLKKKKPAKGKTP